MVFNAELTCSPRLAPRNATRRVIAGLRRRPGATPGFTSTQRCHEDIRHENASCRSAVTRSGGFIDRPRPTPPGVPACTGAGAAQSRVGPCCSLSKERGREGFTPTNRPGAAPKSGEGERRAPPARVKPGNLSILGRSPVPGRHREDRGPHPIDTARSPQRPGRRGQRRTRCPHVVEQDDRTPFEPFGGLPRHEDATHVRTPTARGHLELARTVPSAQRPHDRETARPAYAARDRQCVVDASVHPLRPAHRDGHEHGLVGRHPGSAQLVGEPRAEKPPQLARESASPSELDLADHVGQLAAVRTEA